MRIRDRHGVIRVQFSNSHQLEVANLTLRLTTAGKWSRYFSSFGGLSLAISTYFHKGEPAKNQLICRLSAAWLLKDYEFHASQGLFESRSFAPRVFLEAPGAMCRDASFHLVGDGHGQLGGVLPEHVKRVSQKTVSNRRGCCSTPEP